MQIKYDVRFVLTSNNYLPILKPIISHNAVLRPTFPFIEGDVLWWASLQCFSNSVICIYRAMWLTAAVVFMFVVLYLRDVKFC